jgi:hypothetical protein
MAKSNRDWKVTVVHSVEQPTHLPKIEGSIPATSGTGRKWQKSIRHLKETVAHLVEQPTNGPKFECSNTAASTTG